MNSSTLLIIGMVFMFCAGVYGNITFSLILDPSTPPIVLVLYLLITGCILAGGMIALETSVDKTKDTEHNICREFYSKNPASEFST